MEDDLFSMNYGSEIIEGLEKLKQEKEDKVKEIELYGQVGTYDNKYEKEYKLVNIEYTQKIIDFKNKIEEYSKTISTLNNKLQ